MAGHRLSEPSTARSRIHLAVAAGAHAALTVLGCLLLFVVVGSTAASLEPTVVESGSMQPSLQIGDVVLLDRDADPRTGAVVSFRRPSGATPILHRIVTDDGSTYRTAGDANGAMDPWAVPHDEVDGVARLIIPFVGLPGRWLATGQVLAVAAVTGGVMALWATAAQLRPPPTGAPWWARLPRPRLARLSAAAVRTLLVVGVFAVTATSSHSAAFADTTDNGASSFATTALAAPTGLGATAGCRVLVLGAKVDLAWTASSDATGYAIERATSAGGPYSQVGTSATTSFTDTSVSGSTTYHYRVLAASASWLSAPSASASATTGICL